MTFGTRLATLRRQRALTKPALADRIGIHVSLLRRYKGDTSQPTLGVLRRLAVALAISEDVLIFDINERSPDDDPLLNLKAIQHLSDAENQISKTVIESVLLRREAHRYAPAR